MSGYSGKTKALLLGIDGRRLGDKPCNHQGYLVPTIIIPMQMQVPLTLDDAVAKDEKAQKTAIQTIFRTTEALCVQCNMIFRFEIQTAPPTPQVGDNGKNSTDTPKVDETPG